MSSELLIFLDLRIRFYQSKFDSKMAFEERSYLEDTARIMAGKSGSATQEQHFSRPFFRWKKHKNQHGMKNLDSKFQRDSQTEKVFLVWFKYQKSPSKAVKPQISFDPLFRDCTCTLTNFTSNAYFRYDSSKILEGYVVRIKFVQNRV